MLAPQQVVDNYFLENRHMLLEVAAFLDRYDVAVDHTGGIAGDGKKLEVIRASLEQMQRKDAATSRVERLLELFATV
jgi:hypothetical protein